MIFCLLHAVFVLAVDLPVQKFLQTVFLQFLVKLTPIPDPHGIFPEYVLAVLQLFHVLGQDRIDPLAFLIQFFRGYLRFIPAMIPA